jgi:hypothetical protein
MCGGRSGAEQSWQSPGDRFFVLVVSLVAGALPCHSSRFNILARRSRGKDALQCIESLLSALASCPRARVATVPPAKYSTTLRALKALTVANVDVRFLDEREINISELNLAGALANKARLSCGAFNGDNLGQSTLLQRTEPIATAAKRKSRPRRRKAAALVPRASSM